MKKLELYTNIKNRRKELGITQEELAKKLGYKDRSSIAKIEAGKIDLTESKIMEIADILETTPQKLMGWNSLADSLSTMQADFVKTNEDTITVEEYNFSRPISQKSLSELKKQLKEVKIVVKEEEESEEDKIYKMFIHDFWEAYNELSIEGQIAICRNVGVEYCPNMKDPKLENSLIARTLFDAYKSKYKKAASTTNQRKEVYES